MRRVHRLTHMRRSILGCVRVWSDRENTMRPGVGQHRPAIALAAVFLSLLVEPALAQETMPWEGPLETVMRSLCGPVAQMAAVIAFVVTGLLLAFGELRGLFGVMMRVAFGLSIALFAVNFIDFFGVSGFGCEAGVWV